MSQVELIIRMLFAIAFPPLGVVGLKNTGCGTFLLMCLLTFFFWIPGVILAGFMVFREYQDTNKRKDTEK